jgi:hypothetical protein
MKPMLYVILAAVLFAAPALAREIRTIEWKKDYPEPAPPKDTSEWGLHIQRSMSMLATSTPQHRKTVRILFYGQSIVGQKKWPDAVMARVKERFPHVDIVYDNRAIGGFSSQYLVHTARSDMYPFYPDLVIFHVYGAHHRYQDIIHTLRSRTTAEVAIVTDHLGAREYVGGELKDPGWWKTFMRGTMVPAVAEEYNAEYLDVTTPWIQYLKSNELDSQALLKDGVHPNDHGCFLMSRLVERRLVHRPESPDDEWKNLVTTCEVGEDVTFHDGKLTLEFEGNRVVALPAPGEHAAALEVRIDGKKPSEFIECYTHTRTSGCPGVEWPALLHVEFDALPLVEDWVLTVDEVEKANTDFTFHVEGSKTGPDGSGNSKEKFVSESGRVVIEPEMWMNLERDRKFKGIPIEPGFEVKWSVVPMFLDRYEPVEVVDPSREYLTTLVQNLPNGKHTLELTVVGEGTPRLRALRVHTPPVNRPMEILANPPR